MTLRLIKVRIAVILAVAMSWPVPGNAAIDVRPEEMQRKSVWINEQLFNGKSQYSSQGDGRKERHVAKQTKICAKSAFRRYSIRLGFIMQDVLLCAGMATEASSGKGNNYESSSRRRTS
jgi:hypothetical protein